MQNIKKATEACKLNLTNKTFGELLVLEPTSERKNNSVIWKCQCSCGKIHYAPANELNAYRILSCGHLQESYGATKIQKLLIDNDIPFVKEKTFPTCRFSDSNAYARFDFWVNDEFLIEFDGIQHFREQDNKFFRDSLEKRQEHDNFKNNWCHKNGIPLKRIPYTDQNILTFDMIMGDKYLV